MLAERVQRVHVTQSPDRRNVVLTLWLREQNNCMLRKSNPNQFKVLVVFWNMVAGF